MDTNKNQNIYNYNVIPQFDISSTINERLIYLEAIRQQIEVYLASAPSGNLSVFSGSSPNYFRYYNRESPTDKYGQYLKKEEGEKRDELAQKKYYKVLNKNIKEEMKRMRKILSFNLKDSVTNTYTEIHPGIQKLIQPINVDDNKFVEDWENIGRILHIKDICLTNRIYLNSIRIKEKE